MVQATEVFTPTDVPTHTYVERVSRDFEEDLRSAFTIPKMIVSISGPSKSGKTTLVTKVVAAENLIHIYGASIKRPEDIWVHVISWMGGPIEITETVSSKVSADIGATVGGKVGIPLVVEGRTDVKGTVSTGSQTATASKFYTATLDDVVREIGGSDFVVFVDDFHYIERGVREEIGNQIKAAAELGVRVCTASVPHRSDDVVRSNPELRGRVTAIDITYWSVEELTKIGLQGFKQLNAEIDPALITTLAREAFGSPQLMQTICLNFCFEHRLHKKSLFSKKVIPADGAIQQVFERTTATTDFSTMLSALHAGPKQRGTERKQFNFVDGTSGDVYRCVLLALKSDPSSLAFNYGDMIERTKKICRGDSPVGSSVVESLAQMAKIANLVQQAPVIEWDENVLDIVEPYFLFFLRSSSYLARLAGS